MLFTVVYSLSLNFLSFSSTFIFFFVIFFSDSFSFLRIIVVFSSFQSNFVLLLLVYIHFYEVVTVLPIFRSSLSSFPITLAASLPPPSPPPPSPLPPPSRPLPAPCRATVKRASPCLVALSAQHPLPCNYERQMTRRFQRGGSHARSDDYL